jgi:hypothetical protein
LVPADSEAVWDCLRWFSLVDLGRLSRHAGMSGCLSQLARQRVVCQHLVGCGRPF